MLLHNWCEKGKRGAAENWKKPRKNVWPHRINGSSSVLHLHVHTAFLSLFSEPIISISTNSLSGMFSYSHDDDKALWNWGLYPQQFLSVPWGKFLNLLLVLLPSCLFFVTLCLSVFLNCGTIITGSRAKTKQIFWCNLSQAFKLQHFLMNLYRYYLHLYTYLAYKDDSYR